MQPEAWYPGQIVRVPQLQPAGSPTRILILGAGMAGLAAGYVLTQAGYEVKILEAQDVAGGRVRTLRAPFSPGLWAELGAMFLHSKHPATIAFSEELDLKLEGFPGFATGTSLYYVKGQRIVLPPPGQPASIDWPYPLTAAERQMGLDGMQKRYSAVPVGFTAPRRAGPAWPPPELLPFDRITFTEQMRKMGASPGAVQLLSVGFNSELGDGPAYYSALMALYDERFRDQQPRRFQVVGGNDGYPKAFAARLGSRIVYGAKVVRISQTPRTVVVTVESAGVSSQVEADYAICTLPYKVLRNIPVFPAFSAAKQQVISQMLYTDASRVILEFKDAFWLKEGLNGLVVTDIENMIVYPQPGQPGPGALLNVLQCGTGARAMAARSEEQRIQFTLDQMTRFYPQARDFFVRAATIVWQEDANAGGSHPWFAPNQLTAWLPAIQQNEGRVYFAGDHVSPIPGWIEGALQSASAAALAVGAAASAKTAGAAEGA